uniref:Thioredoxin domain-containing protein n=1 Tax=Roseihalotalea indica TaxID=2867963 RepID=A0AA49JF18_9BACT|nr:thioredoxin domain-containing protein [Tunicatimonas sp. TK19036]
MTSSSSTKPTNHLIHESSPYLLQHAHNPVEWYPWSEQALEKAKKEDKPIIVSIGYSACHWCHVMERESFENEEVAQLMNEHFINIKVDREERPDVDQIYMEAVQTMGLQGGWPLNVFLTPDQKPFYGGTYFPQQNWTQILRNVALAYEKQREQVVESADKFAESLQTSEMLRYGIHPTSARIETTEAKASLQEIFTQLAERFDTEEGGMNKSPKFPMPSQWLFLLRYYFLTEQKEALDQTLLTLNKMAEGGIYDQIGGGFARYSVDGQWFAPHFEKMLYDNGQLLSLYAEAFTLTKHDLYRQVLNDTVRFVERELTSPTGGFYSALDADSEGEEGKYYVWTYDELKEVLGDTTEIVTDYFNATQQGNWEAGNNILHRSLSENEFARKYELDLPDFSALMAKAKQDLLEKRSKRERPGLDNKIIAGWNGMMLRGLIDAYSALGESAFLNLARKNAEFLDQKMIRVTDAEASLLHTYKEGENVLEGFLDDYAFVIDGFLALYQVTFEEHWLQRANQLAQYAIRNFYDTNEQFFFYTAASSELIARKKELFDNVIPASNSVMARNLHKVGILLDDAQYQEMTEMMLSRMIKTVKSYPADTTNWGILYTEMATPLAEVAIVGPDCQEVALELIQHYHPNKVLVGTPSKSDLPLLKERHTEDEQTTLYVCYDKTCQLPVQAVSEALEQLQRNME